MEKFDLSPQVLETIQDETALKDAFILDTPLPELLGFTSEVLAAMYRSAHQLFTEHRYQESSKCFLFLSTLDPYNFDYWLGLGMSKQMCGDYEAGIDAYELAAFIDVENPTSYFYLSRCFFAMHDRENAKRALEMAIEYAEEQPQYATLKAQAKAALTLIQKEL